MRRLRMLIGCLLPMLLTPFALGYAFANVILPEATLPPIHTAPKIDGVIDEAEWGDALRVVGFMQDPTNLEPREGTFWITTDGEKLYLAIKTETPPVGKILSRVQPSETNDVPAYRDDSIELWLDPHRGKTSGDQRYFQIIFNPLGAIYDIAYDPTDKQQKAHTDWRVSWEFKSTIADGWWNVELAIPLSSLGATKEDLAHSWGFRICRNWMQPEAQTDWAPRWGAFEDQKTMAVVNWDVTAPVVRMVSLRKPKGKGVDLALELKNPSDQPQQAQVNLSHQSANNPARVINQLYSLAPNSSQTVRVTEDMLLGKCIDVIKVTSQSGDKVYFRRAFNWQIERPESRWSVVTEQAKAVTLDFGYYPYFNKLKARLDIGGLLAKDRVTGASLKVKNKQSGKIIAEARFPEFKDNRSELIADLPALKGGEYQVEATLVGGAGVPREPIVREFMRKVFEWEHNNLGITDAVIPPFEPLKVNGKDVSAVLRNHRMNDSGLWDQVVSEGVPILAGPMSFEVSVGSQKQTVQITKPLTSIRKKPNQIACQSSWRAGDLTVQMSGDYDIDGMMKIDMRLKESGNAPVDQFDLLIPIRPEVASLMHVSTDGLRFNYAGDLPKGEGLIWESKKASRSELPGTFVPYIWIGNEHQGLCWFAASDRDWMYDDKTSTHELLRLKDQVLLKVHFVTKPGPLNRERHIVFALQATPTKPMPIAPMPWRNWVIDSSFKDKYNIAILGSCYYWGTWTPCCDVYPRDKDFSIYDLMHEVRQTGKVDRTKVEKWLEGYHEKDKAARDYYRAHVEYTMRAMQSQPRAVVPYTNATGAAFNDEFLTFQDEWMRSAYTSRKWPVEEKRAGIAYDVTTVRSLQDYALWYFKKMLDSGAMDGMYFDDTFIKSNFDLVSGGAYIDDNGKLRPSCDLFAMREYLKRAATLCWQMGRPWLDVSHMTNAQIIPVNTWVGINLDWEWKYGMDDFQDRFSRDFIRAETLGLQSGCVPLILPGITGEASKEKREWVERTRCGTTLVHEIRPWSCSGTDYKVIQMLYDFGYGKPECKVHNYWDKDFPAQIAGADASALLLQKEGQAVLVVTDFGNGGNCTVTLDAKSLSLKPNGEFVDLETGKPLQKAGDFACQFELKKHDFKVTGWQ